MAFVPATATVPKPPAQVITALITAATGGSATSTTLPTTATTAPVTTTTGAPTSTTKPGGTTK